MHYLCNRPEAKAVNDNLGTGIYKGVIVGSSGTIKFNVANDGSSITAFITVDGDTGTLVSAVSYVSGQAYLAPFTGTLKGQQVSITFSVSANGTGPVVISSNIPGHPNATITVYKEKSNSQVVCFEGTYTGTTNGVFDMMISTTLGTWTVISKGSTDSTTNQITGTVANNVLNCTSCGNGSSVTGNLNGDVVSGQWNDGTGGSGSWKGNKTM